MQKDKILLECVVSTSRAKHKLKGVLVTKGKFKPKWNLLRCTFLKKLPKVDIAKLMLKISIGSRAK